MKSKIILTALISVMTTSLFLSYLYRQFENNKKYVIVPTVSLQGCICAYEVWEITEKSEKLIHSQDDCKY